MEGKKGPGDDPANVERGTGFCTVYGQGPVAHAMANEQIARVSSVCPGEYSITR